MIKPRTAIDGRIGKRIAVELLNGEIIEGKLLKVDVYKYGKGWARKERARTFLLLDTDMGKVYVSWGGVRYLFLEGYHEPPEAPIAK